MRNKAIALGIKIKSLADALDYLHHECGYPRLDQPEPLPSAVPSTVSAHHKDHV